MLVTICLALLSLKIMQINGTAQQNNNISLSVKFVDYIVQVGIWICFVVVIKSKNKLFVNSKFFHNMENILVLNKLWTAVLNQRQPKCPGCISYTGCLNNL